MILIFMMYDDVMKIILAIMIYEDNNLILWYDCKLDKYVGYDDNDNDNYVDLEISDMINNHFKSLQVFDSSIHTQEGEAMLLEIMKKEILFVINKVYT